jgi:NADPH:quinone reductase-like Zn-dependent oxidoreductase
MKAIVVHAYGGPEVLQFEEHADPVAKSGDVLVRVTATSINPIDFKRRSGAMKSFFPINFPEILGVDVAGKIEKVGPGVQGWKAGDHVFAFADQAYAELCAVKASSLVKVPEGLDVADAAALPLVVTTGAQLISEGTGITAGLTVLVTGAAGNVGRSAVFAAKDRGARVIAAVRKKQLDAAAGLGADAVVAIDDQDAIATLPPLDAVADTVNGKTAEQLIQKIRKGGVFASVLGPPANAKDFPGVKAVGIGARPDAATLRRMSEGILSGKLRIPISRKLPLKEAAAGHAAIEGGLGGKVLLLA